jgi:hypothetical protein
LKTPQFVAASKVTFDIVPLILETVSVIVVPEPEYVAGSTTTEAEAALAALVKRVIGVRPEKIKVAKRKIEVSLDLLNLFLFT